MMFASDLDQTLIYSERSMGESVEPADMIPVELYEGRHISFMTRETVRKLAEVAARMPFVPVTTRTPEQYNRIFTIKDEFRPEYVIVSNGGTILFRGETDREWNDLVRRLVGTHCAAHPDVFDRFSAIATDEWVKSSRLCDGLFYSIVVERDKLPLEAIEGLKREIAALGWSYSLQGRKIYLVPEKVSKGAALAYVKDKLGAGYVYAAGDSLLDESLLLAADYAIAPSHGELGRHYTTHPHIRFTQRTGAQAAEELLDTVLAEAGQEEGLRT